MPESHTVREIFFCLERHFYGMNCKFMPQMHFREEIFAANGRKSEKPFNFPSRKAFVPELLIFDFSVIQWKKNPNSPYRKRGNAT